MEEMILVLQVASASVALEVARLLWHGRLQGAPALVVVHALLAAWLGGLLWWPLGLVAAASVVASWALLDAKRAGRWLGVLASGLSAYPWHGAALLALGWSDPHAAASSLLVPLYWPSLAGLWLMPSWLAPSWPSPWILAGVPIGWLAGLPWVSALRPDHWTPSRWAWAYPARIRRRA